MNGILNLDFIFLLKGFLALLIATVLLFRSHFFKQAFGFHFLGYLLLFAMHAWVHMGALGFDGSIWIRILLVASQAGAWTFLAMAGAEILHPRRIAWKIRFWPAFVLVAGLLELVPHFPHPAAARVMAGGAAMLLAGFAFFRFPVLQENHGRIQRFFFLFLLLPTAMSTLFPIATFVRGCLHCTHAEPSFLIEFVEMASLLAAFGMLHVFLVREQAPILNTPFGRRTIFHMKLISFLLLTVFVVGILWAHSAAVRSDGQERRRLLRYLHNASLAFSPREVALLSGTREDLSRLPYRDLKSRLQELVRYNPDTRFSYLMGLRGNDVIFLADSAPDDDANPSLPGDVYADASSILRSVLQHGEEATEGPLPDAWGIWVSAFVPIRDRERVIAVLGMDVDARDWQKMLYRARLTPLLVTSLFSLLLLGVFVYIRRITENQEAIAASENKYRLLFEESQDAYLLLRDVFVDCNPAAERLFGCPRDQIVGHAPWEFSPERQPDGRLSQKLAQEHISLAMAGKPQAFSWIHRNAAGDVLHTDVRLNRLPMEPPTLQAIIRDRTEEMRRAEKQRKMENRMAEMQKWEGLANLAGGVAHDFNNLLTNIVGNVHLAQMEAQSPERLEQCHNAILESARLATDLARQMLAYAGKGSLSVRPFSLADVLRQMEKVLRSIAGSRARVELELEDGLPAVLGDPTQLQQVVLNLVMNAVEAMERSDGMVRISLSQQHFSEEEMQECTFREPPPAGTYLVLRVRDNGKGIAPDVLPRIFEPFFTTKFTGRGLGLAAVAGIIHNHGGAIAVRSTPGEGTEFEIRLPVTHRKPEPKSFLVAEEEPAPMQPLRILVVEDEDNLRQLAERVLARQGHTVFGAVNGEEGLRLALENRGKLDLVFADVLMPRMDGIEMARRIRREFPDLPILLTSGHVPGDGSDYLSFTDGFLPKPYHYKELLKKIYETVSKK